MLRSMTGYGRGSYENDFREYTVEIKSVNNRYTDISIKMPRNISFLEDNIKKLISNAITRGKVEVFITFINNSNKCKDIKINSELAKKYIEEMKRLAKETGIESNIEVIDIMKMPEILNLSIDESDEEIIKQELTIATRRSNKQLYMYERSRRKEDRRRFEKKNSNNFKRN